MSQAKSASNIYGTTSIGGSAAAVLGDVHNTGLTIIQHATIVQQGASLLEEHDRRTRALEVEVAEIRRQLRLYKPEVVDDSKEAGALTTSTRWEDVLIGHVIIMLNRTEQLLELQNHIFAALKDKYEKDANGLQERIETLERQGRANTDDVEQAVRKLDDAGRKVKHTRHATSDHTLEGEPAGLPLLTLEDLQRSIQVEQARNLQLQEQLRGRDVNRAQCKEQNNEFISELEDTDLATAQSRNRGAVLKPQLQQQQVRPAKLMF